MLRRKVTKSRKDSDGDIIALCNPSEDWSPRRKDDVISDIELNAYSYYVIINDSKEVEIRVINDPDRGKYLRTDPDETSENNLDDLPDC